MIAVAEYVLAWTSGYPDRRPLYLLEHSVGWGSTEDRGAATRYASEKAAVKAWLEKHAFPEDYEKSVKSGAVRAELFDQSEFTLSTSRE